MLHVSDCVGADSLEDSSASKQHFCLPNLNSGATGMIHLA